MNISSALLFEYEAKLKIEALRQNRPLETVDRFLNLLVAVANRRQIHFLLRPFLPDIGDDFILELAVASRADFIVTYNLRDFAGAARYGISVIRPHELLEILRNQS